MGMVQKDLIKKNFNVLAETENDIYFLLKGEKIAYIDGHYFDACETVKEFYEFVELWYSDIFED